MSGRAATVASWLGVTALGLSIGALGIGGVLDLVDGNGEPVPLSSSVSSLEQEVPSSPIESRTQAGERALTPGQVVAPSARPDGQPLPGGGAEPRVARDGRYAPFVPSLIRLPSGATTSVVRAGVHADGALAVPENPGQVGWWTGGAQAGEPYGTTVLAGHVDSRSYGLGFLAELRTMKVGQVVQLSAGTQSQSYRVRAVRRIPKASLAAGTDLFDQEVGHRLVLITCGGPFDRSTHRYQDNVVLVATPIG